MPQFGSKSLERLKECHPDLQALFLAVVKHYDCTVTCGYRGKEDQEQAFREGKSKLHFPASKHNISPSRAVDVVPYPVDWKDTARFFHFAGFVQGVAKEMGIDIRWGGDWDSDNNFKNDSFVDMPHFELVGNDNAST